jgi:SAM-dependent methyltransferase
VKQARKNRGSSSDAERFEVSAFVRRQARDLREAAIYGRILDVPCGSGRNSLFLAKLGCKVTCVDIELSKLKEHLAGHTSLSRNVRLVKTDLINEPWPFDTDVFAAIINVHFFVPSLLRRFSKSLIPGGYLIIESPPGHGGNYLALPAAGTVRRALESDFDLLFYEERRVGPFSHNAVTVKLVATKR